MRINAVRNALSLKAVLPTWSAKQNGSGAKQPTVGHDAMNGFIRKWEVIKETRLTIRLYGVKVWVSCLLARKATFLEILIRNGKL